MLGWCLGFSNPATPGMVVLAGPAKAKGAEVTREGFAYHVNHRTNAAPGDCRAGVATESTIKKLDEMPRDRVYDACCRQVRSGLVWGFSCQAVVLGCAEFFVRSGKGRFSSRRLQSGPRSARKGSRDRNASGAWRLAAWRRWCSAAP